MSKKIFWEYAKLAGGLVLDYIFAPSKEEFELRQAIEEEKKKEEQKRKEREEADRKEQELLATMTPREKGFYLLGKGVKELKLENARLKRELSSAENDCRYYKRRISDLESEVP